jgi:hypothetical protein
MRELKWLEERSQNIENRYIFLRRLAVEDASPPAVVPTWLEKKYFNSNRPRGVSIYLFVSCIVEHQKAFLEIGPEAMKPLVLRDVAEEVELHVLIIARIAVEDASPPAVVPTWLEKKYFNSNRPRGLKVASCIVEHQKAFLEIGPEAMKPLVLRDVAEEGRLVS